MPFLSKPSFMPRLAGCIGSRTPFHPWVGSTDSETARNPYGGPLCAWTTVYHRPASGSYVMRGSFNVGSVKPGFAFFQNSVWVMRRRIWPVFLS